MHPEISGQINRANDGRSGTMLERNPFWSIGNIINMNRRVNNRHKTCCREHAFLPQPASVHGWTSAFLLDVHRLCGAIEGKLSHAATLTQDGLAECDQPGKNPLKYSTMTGNKTRATGGQTVRSIHSLTEPSGPGPQGGQTVRFIHSPTELSWLIWCNLHEAKLVEQGRCGDGNAREQHGGIKQILLKHPQPNIHLLKPGDLRWSWESEQLLTESSFITWPVSGAYRYFSTGFSIRSLPECFITRLYVCIRVPHRLSAGSIHMAESITKPPSYSHATLHGDGSSVVAICMLRWLQGIFVCTGLPLALNWDLSLVSSKGWEQHSHGYSFLSWYMP